MRKTLLLAASAAMVAGFATTAAASTVPDTQETGNVVLQGHVPAFCYVAAAGTPPSGSFGDTVVLDQGTPPSIADTTTGKLLASLSGATSSTAGFNRTYEIVCTGANNSVTLTATAMNNASGSAATGYATKVDYTAEADYAVVGGAAVSPITQTYVTATSASTGPTTLGANVRLAVTNPNVTLKFYAFNTPGANDVLEAGTYTGTITVTITAGA